MTKARYTLRLRVIRKNSIGNKLRRLFGVSEKVEVFKYSGQGEADTGLLVYQAAIHACNRKNLFVIGFDHADENACDACEFEPLG